jgi:hypothetical protein
MILPHMPRTLTPELITAVIDGFQEQKKRIDAQIAELRQMLDGSIDAARVSDATETTPARKRSRMSAAARARIAAAQRRRWAAKRGDSTAETTTAPARKKRGLSAAGRKAIIEATKRRWAVLRAATKQ